MCYDSSDEDGKPIGKRELRDHVINTIIAGRDTSAQALSWTMFRLLSDPKLIEVLREEIDSIGELTYENYKVSNQGLYPFRGVLIVVTPVGLCASPRCFPRGTPFTVSHIFFLLLALLADLALVT